MHHHHETESRLRAAVSEAARLVEAVRKSGDVEATEAARARLRDALAELHREVMKRPERRETGKERMVG